MEALRELATEKSVPPTSVALTFWTVTVVYGVAQPVACKHSPTQGNSQAGAAAAAAAAAAQSFRFVGGSGEQFERLLFREYSCYAVRDKIVGRQTGWCRRERAAVTHAHP